MLRDKSLPDGLPTSIAVTGDPFQTLRGSARVLMTPRPQLLSLRTSFVYNDNPGLNGI